MFLQYTTLYNSLQLLSPQNLSAKPTKNGNQTTDTLPEGWVETTLSSIADVQTGPFGSQLHEKDYVDIGTPMITVEHLVDDKILHDSDIPKVSDEDRTRLSRYLLQEGDIVFSRVGSVDRSAYVSTHEDGWMFSGRLLRVRTKDETINKRWLHYWLTQQSIKKFVTKIAVGATMPSINTTLLGEVPVMIPPRNIQDTIAVFFTFIDDKIDLLRRQNKTLEAIAQTLFKRWFVEFNFPNEEGKPYRESGGKMVESELGEIPEGWRVGSITTIIKRHSITYRCNKDDLNPKGKTPILDQGTTGLYGYTDRKPDFEASFENPVVIFTNHTCNTWFIDYPFCAIQNVIPFRGIDGYDEYFLYFMTKGQISFIEYKGHWPEFEAKQYVIPPMEIARDFGKIAKNILAKFSANNSQIRTLTQLRDTLLPKLVGGEIAV